VEQHEYKGYRIIMERYGNGWRSMVYPPKSSRPIPGPQSDDPTSHKTILDQAKDLIDRGAI
jgi:hypothetical protein